MKFFFDFVVKHSLITKQKLIFQGNVVVHSRTIHVSKNGNSTDNEDCGSFIKPCKHLRQAIKISDPFDIILMDSSYIYYQNNPISIPHSLTISSYFADQHIGNQDDKATLDFLVDGITFFSIHQDLNLTNIVLIVNPRSSVDVFILFSAVEGQNVSKISVIDCIFQLQIVTQMTLYHDFASLEIEFKETNFVAPLTNQRNTRRKERWDFKRKNEFEQNSVKRVVFYKCNFLHFNILEASQANSEWYFWNNTFKRTGLVINGEMSLVQFVQNLFDYSFLALSNSDTSPKLTEIKERSTKLVGCTFRTSIIQLSNFGKTSNINDLFISNSHFENSPVTVWAYAFESSLIFNVTVENSLFTGSGYYPSASQLELTNLSKSTVKKATILNCTFKNLLRPL